MLHLLMHSPYQCDIDILMQLLKKGDDLLLLQDGVTAAVGNSQILDKLCATHADLHVLNEDVIARGIAPYLSSEVSITNYRGFVKLTEKHQHQMTW